MNNLSRDIKILLTDQQIFNYDQALPYLRRKENLILAEYKAGTITKFVRQSNFSRTSPNFHKRPLHNTNSNSTNTNTLPYHNSKIVFNNNFKKNNFHQNQKEHSPETKNNYSNKSYAFIESTHTQKPFELDVKIGTIKTKALIDSSAGETYVSR